MMSRIGFVSGMDRIGGGGRGREGRREMGGGDREIGRGGMR